MLLWLHVSIVYSSLTHLFVMEMPWINSTGARSASLPTQSKEVAIVMLTCKGYTIFSISAHTCAFDLFDMQLK